MPSPYPFVTVSGGGGGSVTAADITDSTVPGRGVLTGTSAEGVAALGLSTAPLASPGDWTLPSGVALAASILTATLTTGGGAARIVGEVGYAQRRTGLELVAHIAYSGSLSSPTQTWAEVGLNAADRAGFHFQLRGDGQLDAMKMPGFSGGSASASASGTWVRAIATTVSTVDTYYSTAASRPTTEADWTFIGTLASVPSDNALLHAGVASSDAVDAVAEITGLTLRGWPL